MKTNNPHHANGVKALRLSAEGTAIYWQSSNDPEAPLSRIADVSPYCGMTERRQRDVATLFALSPQLATTLRAALDDLLKLREALSIGTDRDSLPEWARAATDLFDQLPE